MTGDDPASFNAGTRILAILEATEMLEIAADDGATSGVDAGDDTAGAPTDPKGAAASGNAAAASLDSLIEATGVSDDATITGQTGTSVEDSMNQMIGNQ